MTWQNTTHDWARDTDVRHLEQIREGPTRFAPGGVLHLVLEVLAYAADEAASRGGGGHAVVTMHADGSISVADNGRGTDTRVDDAGRAVKKPVMATKDLRFFDEPSERLADGHFRRGMSVVAALSEWLVHTNRRVNGSWTQRYEHGVPVTDLTPIESDGTTGTTVHFLPSPGLAAMDTLPTDFGPHLTVELR